MVVKAVNEQRHRSLALCLAAALAAVCLVSSSAQALDPSQRGRTAPEWARAAVPGPAAVNAVDDEESVVGEGADALPMVTRKGAAIADAAADARVRGPLDALNATQKSAFKVSLDGESGKVKLLYGSVSRNYANGAETAARGFLADAQAVLGLRQDLSDLRTARVDETDEKNHVRFQQTYNGIPVVGANVVVHANKAGQVTMVQNGYVEGLQPVNGDVIAETAAKGIALDDFKASNIGIALSEGKIEKQIVLLDGKYCIAWKVTIPAKSPVGLWVYHVDAESGRILYKKNEIVAVRTGRGKAYTTNEKFLLNRMSSVALKNLGTAAETPYWGNLFGRFTGVLTYDPANDWFAFGPYSAKYYFVYDPVLNPDEFHAVQAYYAVDSTRDWWLKKVISRFGPSYATSPSNPFTWNTPVLVNYAGFCNAFYTSDLGDGIPGMVYGNENSCPFPNNDLVMDWDVVRHEYTHAMMDWAGFEGQFGGYVDYYGRAMGEGNADWFAYLHHPREPRMATVAWAESSAGYLRNLQNTRMYPWDVDYAGYGPEEHYTGEIWGGYLHDLYRVLGSTRALKYVYQSLFYFDPGPGFMSGQPDFWDAIYAQMIAEYDITGKYTSSFKAWGSMAGRGINGLLEPVYSSSDYFHTGTAGQDDRWYWYWSFPSIRVISTKGNMLMSNDTHEYIVRTNNSSMKLTATVTGVSNGMTNPVIGLFDQYGNQVTAPVTSTNGRSVTLKLEGLTPKTYVIRVTGQTATPGKGYYNFKVSIL